MVSPKTDIGNQVKAILACASDVVATGAPKLVVAGGASDDATERQGYTIDRQDASGGLAMSAKIVTVSLHNLADTETLSLAHEYEDSADGTTFNTAVAIEASTVKATASGAVTGGTFSDEHILDLSPLNRYFRINVTPDFSASGTDTGLFATVVILGGFETTPVS